MPELEQVNPPKRKQPKSPEDRPIDSKNYCALCLYNIPRGSLMIVLPGLSMLLMGVILISLTETSSSWGDGTAQVALIMLVIGGVITVGGTIYWIVMWCKHRPEKKKTSSKQTVAPRDGTVELVAVHHTNGHDNPAYSGPHYSVTNPNSSGVITVS